MVDTNALLSIALSLVAQFAQVVKLPEGAIPRATNDLASYSIGSAASPIDTHLVDRNGNQFWIHEGVVGQYMSPGTFYFQDEAVPLDRFNGPATLSSNAVVDLATGILRRLARKPWPVTNDAVRKLLPHVDHARGNAARRLALWWPVRIPEAEQAAKAANEPERPFYLLTWHRSDLLGEGAQIEIDARRGEVVSLLLDDPAFPNPTFAQQISNRVYKPEPATVKAREPVRPKGIRRDLYPLPTTNQVLKAIGGWLKFCRAFGIDHGGETNLSDINWDESMIVPNPELSPLTNVCQIAFRNGTAFQALNGTAISSLGPDVIAMGIRGLYRGTNYIADYTPTKNWKELAAKFETLVVARAGVPRPFLENYHAVLDYGDGIHFNYKHCLVDWCKKGPEYENMIPYERPMAMSAEFDLDTGQIKGLNLLRPIFVFWQRASSVTSGGK